MIRIVHLLQRLRRNNKGLALVEFALAAPLFLTILLVGLELANLSVTYMRISQMAMTVADNAGRSPTGVDEANVYEVFAGASLIGDSLDFEPNGRVILSSLEENGLTGADKGQMIGWQRCWGDKPVQSNYGTEGTGRHDASLADGMGQPGAKLVAPLGSAVMFVEVTYEYQSLVADGFFDPPTISYETAYNVRGRTNNAITNSGGLAVMDCN